MKRKLYITNQNDVYLTALSAPYTMSKFDIHNVFSQSNLGHVTERCRVNLNYVLALCQPDLCHIVNLSQNEKNN